MNSLFYLKIILSKLQNYVFEKVILRKSIKYTFIFVVDIENEVNLSENM